MSKGNRQNAMPPSWQPLIEACGGGAEFAIALGVNRSTLSRWAHGAAVTAANARKLRELAELYAVPVPAFEEGSGKDTAPMLPEVAEAVARFGTAAAAARALGMSPPLFAYHSRNVKKGPLLAERLRAVGGEVE